METKSRERIGLQDKCSQAISQIDLGTDSNVVQENKVNNETRVAQEHDIICDVDLPMICLEQDMDTTHLADDNVETLMNASSHFRDILINTRDVGIHSQVVQEKNLFDDHVKYDGRVVQEHDIIHSVVGLPMICWRQHKVTRHLADDDVEALINSSPYFRDNLKNQRTLILSKKVLTVLFAWLCEEVRTRNLYYDRSCTLRKYLFKCRLVCKSWCASFDELVQQELINKNHVVLDFYGSTRVSNHGWRLCLVSKPACVIEFIQHFEKTHPPGHLLNSRSPFITRKLDVTRYSYFDESRAIDYWNRSLLLLQNYGNHIWHLNFSIYNNDDKDPSQLTYLNIRKMLLLTPNLKTLSMKYEYHAWYGKGPTESFIQDHPLPKLTSLNSLEISKAHSTVVSHILRQSDHVTKLELSYIREVYDCNVMMGSLEDLTVKVKKCQDLSHFANPLAPTWPVKKLNLDFGDAYFIVGGLKIASDNWSESCEDLMLILPVRGSATEILRECVDFRLHFPKVKVLYLRTNGDLISFDLFLNMKSLERVTIDRGCSWYDYDYGEEEEEAAREILMEKNRQVIKFYGHEENMYESNIWKLFPKLKYLEIDEIKYHRAVWIQRNKKNASV